MYALVDLVFVIKRNWELWAPAIPHGFLGLAISISINVLETTDLVYADLILFTSLLACVAGTGLFSSENILQAWR